MREYANGFQFQSKRSMHRPLEILLRSHGYAVELRRSVWDFGVEIDVLKDLGVDESDLRWLECKGFVEHAREVTREGQQQRTFEPTGPLRFEPGSCFVLTEGGVRYASRVLHPGSFPDNGRSVGANGADESHDGPAECSERSTPPVLPTAADTRTPVKTDSQTPPKADTRTTLRLDSRANVEVRAPVWDAQRRELRLGSELVKQFKLPSPNQEYVLTTFQEEGWPPRIDDPLPPLPESHPKQRLRETIRSLNRHQKSVLRVRFRGDGTGEGVLWEVLAANK